MRTGMSAKAQTIWSTNVGQTSQKKNKTNLADHAVRAMVLLVSSYRNYISMLVADSMTTTIHEVEIFS